MVARKTKTDEPEWAHRDPPADLTHYDARSNVDEPSTALAPVTEGEIVQGGPATKALIGWLAEKANRGDEATWEDMENIIRQMLTSDTPDEVLRTQAPIHGKDFVDTPFGLHRIEVREGDYEEGSPFYAVMHVTIGSPPENRVITCGGWRVLAQLMMLDNMDDWPQIMMIRAAETRKGYKALRLERPL